MDRRNVDIVLVRMDKIGDLVLSMPVDEHPVCQGARVHWFISSGLGWVASQAAPPRAFSEFKRGFSPFEFIRMYKWLRANQPQTIVLLHNPWWVSCAAWLAGVPERMGRQSQWHSFLFLNLPILQKRSASDRHESDFNFDLVEWGFNRLGVRTASNLATIKHTFLKLIAPDPLVTLQARNLTPREYRVVHPGMAGSALNWPSEYFVELIEKLALDLPVVITGTKMDNKYLHGLKALKENSQVRWLVGELNTSELLDILSLAKSVVAPSTGVLHLAASLGTPALGIYSPRKVEHPLRWGPRGPRAGYLLPPTPEIPTVTEPVVYTAEVMREIPVKKVFNSLHELERENGNARSQSHPGV